MERHRAHGRGLVRLHRRRRRRSGQPVPARRQRSRSTSIRAGSPPRRRWPRSRRRRASARRSPGRAPVFFAVDHYSVYRGGAFVTDTTATTFTDLTRRRRLVHLPGRREGLAATSRASHRRRSRSSSTPPRPRRRARVPAAAALDGSVGIAWAAASDGAGSGVTRYVVRRSLSSSPPVSAADGDATCQGLFTSCADATTLNGKLYSYAVFAVDAVGNTSAAGVSVGRDRARPARAGGARRAWPRRPATAASTCAGAAAGADDDVAGYVLVAKQGAAAPVERGRRHARLHGHRRRRRPRARRPG